MIRMILPWEETLKSANEKKGVYFEKKRRENQVEMGNSNREADVEMNALSAAFPGDRPHVMVIITWIKYLLIESDDFRSFCL